MLVAAEMQRLGLPDRSTTAERGVVGPAHVVRERGVVAVPWLFQVPRALLLLLIGLGVAGMHTTGHPSATHDMSGTPAVFHMSTTQVLDAVSPAHGLPGDVQPMPPHTALPQPALGMDPVKVCLAVLTLVGWVLLTARAVSAARHLAGTRTPPPVVLPTFGRGPPRLPSFGLGIADLSVHRAWDTPNQT